MSTSTPLSTTDPLKDPAFIRQLAELRSRLLRRPADVTQSRTLNETFGEVRVDATTGVVTITLPPAHEQIAREYTVKKVDSSGNGVTLAAASGDLIDGLSTQSLSSQYDSITVKSNGGQTWDVIGRTGTGAGGAWTVVKKLADESIVSDNALSNDSELVVPLQAGARYHLRGKVPFYSLDTAMAYKYQLVYSGTAAEIIWHRRQTALGVAAGRDTEDTAQGIGTPPATQVVP